MVSKTGRTGSAKGKSTRKTMKKRRKDFIDLSRGAQLELVAN